MRKSLYDYCMEQGLEYLLKQWDTERNAPLTPQTVTAGSSDKRIWWRCEKGLFSNEYGIPERISA